MDLFGGLQRAYGQFDKNVMGGVLPGGAQVNPKISGTVLAAQEAIPAILQGKLGLGDRTDTSIDPRIAKGLIEARKNAKERGSNHVAYEDYNTNTGGGYAAKHTFGRVADHEFKLDDKGNVTGVIQKYDTDKTPEQLQTEIDSGGPFYKHAEKMLAESMPGGITTHDVNFAVPTIAGQAPTAPAPVAATPVAPPIKEQPIPNAPGAQPTPATPATTYAIQAGDTLTAIARQQGTTVADLARLNNISNPNLINVGQQLRFK